MCDGEMPQHPPTSCKPPLLCNDDRQSSPPWHRHQCLTKSLQYLSGERSSRKGCGVVDPVIVQSSSTGVNLLAYAPRNTFVLCLPFFSCFASSLPEPGGWCRKRWICLFRRISTSALSTASGSQQLNNMPTTRINEKAGLSLIKQEFAHEASY